MGIKKESESFQRDLKIIILGFDYYQLVFLDCSILILNWLLSISIKYDLYYRVFYHQFLGLGWDIYIVPQLFDM